ncbi:hypothetical protein MKX08_004731 [Trichoderma sp. CBMAI-0020]|nr:hypothetical protein MKX08_004731 [Trichoderma sp. CBMAI-0020]
MAETLSCSLDKAERDSVLDLALGPTETALDHGRCASSAAGAVNTSSALVAHAAHAHAPAPAPVPPAAPIPARGQPEEPGPWILFCPGWLIIPVITGGQNTGMEQCSIPVQHASGKVRPRAHNVAPGRPLRALLGSLVQNTSLHRPVFRFPLPVFPGVKRGPFEQATGQGLLSCGVVGGEACYDS